MPGLSLVLNVNSEIDYSEVRSILSIQNYLDGYTSRNIITENNLFIGCNVYPDYPLHTFSNEDLVIIIEGKVYNKNESELSNELISLSNQIQKNGSINSINPWLQNADGDFIIIIYNKKSKTFYLFNDIFGRLPLYYKLTEGGIIVSRYLNFINNINPKTDFDKIAISQFLMFGYILNNRTIYNEINHLRPATLIKYQNNKVTLESVFKFNFQQRKYINRDLDENLSNLEELFSISCKNRFLNNKPNIVTLSGGLDSRLVASCMYKNKIPFSTVTFRHKDGSVIRDEQIAIELSKMFGVEHRTLEINPPTGDDVITLLKIKEGMNSLFTSYLLPFYHQVKSIYGNEINFITGDNGDKLIFTLDKPVKSFNSSDELAHYIYTEHALLEAEKIQEFTGIEKNTILEEIKNLLDTFQEDNLWQKYVHFKIMERPHKFAFQGEDRHRHFFWSISPFWSFPFYNYIMNCSDISKKQHKLYAGLIKRFSSEAIQLPYSNFKSSVNSLKGKIGLSMLYHIYPRIPKSIKIKFKVGFLGWNPKVKPDSLLVKCIKEQYAHSDKISDYLRLSDHEELKMIRKATLFNILTVTSSIENYQTGKSSLFNYLKNEFK
ncbi:MAG: asparagine synthase-related protein [Ignavibacteriaceae bacterium]